MTGSMRFAIDYNRLTSERTFFMHWESWSLSLDSKSSCLGLRAMDDDSSRCRLMAPDYIVSQSMVMPCARCKAQHGIAFLLLLFLAQGSAG